MSVRTYTARYQHCDRCQCDDRSGTAQFTEYPNGAGKFLECRIDLCDRCVLAGFVVFRGRIIQGSEAELFNLPD